MNDQNRQSTFPLVFKDKDGETVLTGSPLLDGYFNYNFARPIDNTQTISVTIGRTNEFSLALASIGIESNYKNIIGRLWLQTGSMLNVVQETDGSVLRGRNTSTGNLKFIREAAAGYHFNKAYGLNVELSIFMSFISLESYVMQDNWNYQRSMACDFTPFYFQGARVQFYPSKKFRIELWLMNGWQTYNSFNKRPGVGSSNYFRPSENLPLMANFYYGNDARPGTDSTARGRAAYPNVMRFHHDNFVVARYYHKDKVKLAALFGITQAAFSLNTHYGFQSGDGLRARDNFIVGSSLANRVWFAKNKMALTARMGFVKPLPLPQLHRRARRRRAPTPSPAPTRVGSRPRKSPSPTTSCRPTSSPFASSTCTARPTCPILPALAAAPRLRATPTRSFPARFSPTCATTRTGPSCP